MNDWFNAENHAERAHQFYEAGQWDKALFEMRRAIHFNPGHSDWHFGLALTLDALERYEEAIESFRQVLRLREDDVEAKIHLCHDLIRVEQTDEAVQLLNTVDAFDPQYHAAHCLLILAYGDLGQHERAEEVFYLAQQVDDQCPTCFDHIGQSLFDRDEFDRATWCWQQVLRIEPNYPQVYANLARIHQEKDQPERARQLFMQQLRHDPGDIDTLVDLGKLLMQMGRNTEAGEKFRRALELDPSVAIAHRYLGQLALLTGHLDAAESALHTAAQLDDELPGVHRYLAEIAHKRGDINQARRLARKELRFAKDNGRYARELAKVMIQLRDVDVVPGLLTPLIDALATDAAVTSPRPLVPTAPRTPVEKKTLENRELYVALVFYRGVSRMITGEHVQGMRDCRQVLRIDSQHAMAMQNLAMASIEIGAYRRAQYWLDRALAIEPENTDLRQLQQRLVFIKMRVWLRRLRDRLLPWFASSSPTELSLVRPPISEPSSKDPS